jgi:hypothetical protein
MNPVSSVAEHWDLLLYLLVGSVGLIMSLIALVYRGMVRRISTVENKIPEGIITMAILEQHCQEAQTTCPYNAKIDQISADTKYLRETMIEINKNQKILREETLPDKYLKIVEYDKNHLRIEMMLKDNVKDIKDLIEDKFKTIKDVVQVMIDKKEK